MCWKWWIFFCEVCLRMFLFCLNCGCGRMLCGWICGWICRFMMVIVVLSSFCVRC